MSFLKGTFGCLLLALAGWACALTPEQALAELLAVDMDSRRTAVAKDVRSRSPRYRCIPAHDLADALGIPESRRPGSEWSFTRYARLMTVEEYELLMQNGDQR